MPDKRNYKNNATLRSNHGLIRHIVVVGGGSAGWLTACRLAASFTIASEVRNASAKPTMKVTVIESPDVATVGVGEGTWPTMRKTLQAIGVRETDFIRECQATFKQGAKFGQWMTGKPDDYYYHPLMLPVGFGRANLPLHWQTQQQNGSVQSFSAAVCPQESICDLNKAPKTLLTAEYDGVANYAYHLDAGLFTEFLKKHGTQKLGVHYVSAHIQDVILNTCGDIQTLITDTQGNIDGDFFVDCSGFSGLLIDKVAPKKWIDFSDQLFADTAIAIQQSPDMTAQKIGANSKVNHPSQPHVRSQTNGTAQRAGWIWDIPLQHRRGVGHVYASRYLSETGAMQDLAQYMELSVDALEALSPRKIDIPCGHRKTFWQRNCVAVGLSAGFIEPLEASALVMVELSAEFLVEQLPFYRAELDIVSRRFNDVFTYRWRRIVDFLKLHYCISQRDDHPFWIDNRNSDSWSDELRDMLALWKYRPPSNADFDSNNEVFPAASYQYILYGMQYGSDFSALAERFKADPNLAQYFHKNQQITAQALQRLPDHRVLLNAINEHGLQRV